MSPRVRLRAWREGAHGQCVKTDLDTLATALYARIDDELKASPWLAPWRPAVGITPTLSDTELVTLAVMSALLGCVSERRWLRRAGRERDAQVAPLATLPHGPAPRHRSNRMTTVAIRPRPEGDLTAAFSYLRRLPSMNGAAVREAVTALVASSVDQGLSLAGIHYD